MLGWPKMAGATATGRWTYTDGAGNVAFVVCRFNLADGGKQFRPAHPVADGWRVGDPQGLLPLYGLPNIVDGETVFIVEGEKAADAGRLIGLTCTTSAHGSKSAAKSDWTPLAGRHVVILPDNDPPGEQYARDVTAILLALGCEVRIVRLPNLPPGGDIYDFIEARDSRESEDLKRMVEAIARETEPERAPRGLVSEPAGDATGTAPEPIRWVPFPVDVLPEPIRTFVDENTKALGCDAAYVALPTLVVLASAIGNTRRIQLKRTWTEPPILWGSIIGESGTLKTPASRRVIQPVKDRQRVALELHKQEQVNYEAALLKYDKALNEWKRSKVPYSEPPEKPEAPTAVRCIVSDCTVEGLAPILLQNPRGVLVARDELAGWLGSFDRYASGGRGGGDVSAWLSMHTGEPIIIDRKTGTRIQFIPSAAASIIGGIQPEILNRAIGSEHKDNGLLARLLLAMPPRRPKHWSEAELPKHVEAAYVDLVDRLYRLEPATDDDGEPFPQTVHLSADAKRRWVAFYDEHASEQAKLTGSLAAAWSKLEAAAARFALIVHCVRTAVDGRLHPNVVDVESVEIGITLARWFGHEARRVYGAMAESEEHRERRLLVELIRGAGGGITANGLARMSRRYQPTETARQALEALVVGGLGHWTDPAPGPDGGRPSRVFRLNSEDAVAETPHHDSATGGLGYSNACNTSESCSEGDQ